MRVDPHEADEFHRAAAIAVAGIPVRIGSWNGTDYPLPPSAIELLRPNATLNRVYTNNMGREVGFLLVQCRDSRDMLGHYPPICYKGQGWEVPEEKATLQTWAARFPEHHRDGV